MAQVIDNMNADSIFVDCCDVNQERFKAEYSELSQEKTSNEEGKAGYFFVPSCR